jgi:hypothetical protein
MTIVFALAVFWFIGNVFLLVGLWASAARDVRFGIDISEPELRRITRSLRFFPVIGIVQWVMARGKPWQQRALAQFGVGLPIFVAVVVVVAVLRR